MKKTIYTLSAFAAIYCMILFAPGCTKQTAHEHGPDCDHATASASCETEAHKPKYNQVLAEFPGHKYAMEIIDDEATGLVTAFLTNAHFEPTAVDAKEVRLNFLIVGKPKTFVLTRAEQEAGKPATFTLTDTELAELACDGWQGEAAASVEIGGVPYSAKLIKLADGEHSHAH